MGAGHGRLGARGSSSGRGRRRGHEEIALHHSCGDYIAAMELVLITLDVSLRTARLCRDWWHKEAEERELTWDEIACIGFERSPMHGTVCNRYCAVGKDPRHNSDAFFVLYRAMERALRGDGGGGDCERP